MRHAADDQPEGHHHDVQRPAGGPARPGADVVGRRRQLAVLPAQGRRAGGAGVLVPAGRQGDGRQRPDGGARPGQEPGAGPPLPRLHARRRRTPSTTSGTSATSRRRTIAHGGVDDRRRLRAGEPRDRDREAGVVRRGLPAARAAAGDRRGLAPGLAAVQGRRADRCCYGPLRAKPASAGAAAACCGRRSPCRARCGCCCCSSCRCTSCWPSSSAASTRSSARRCRCGTRSSGTPRSSPTSSGTSSGRTATSGRRCCGPRCSSLRERLCLPSPTRWPTTSPATAAGGASCSSRC